MFESLSERLGATLKNLRGQGRLTEVNIKDALREVRMALLEADVALSVVDEFVQRVRQLAVGQEVLSSLTPGQAFIGVVRKELEHIMGDANEGLNLRAQPPVVILMAGLQGSGKTTTVAKLARMLKAQKKSVLVASADVYRPAAIDQLEALAKEVGVGFFPTSTAQAPVRIAHGLMEAAKKQFVDVVILDTAGRLHVDDQMMSEIKQLHAVVQPTETLFVVDSMTGQDAAITARAFNEALPLTGIILTKIDGDARGGAALSIRSITGKPIKFLGVGEKSDALEPFYPDRIASRILGMGDILSLIEEAERSTDKNKAEKLAKKLQKGKGFNLEDFRDQLIQMRNMGGLTSLMEKMPGMGNLPANAKQNVDDSELVRMEAIINSMTPQERFFPKMIKGSRKKRIASGSGTQVQEVNKLLKQFEQMQRMMKRMNKKGAMQKMMRGMSGGGMPPGMPPM